MGPQRIDFLPKYSEEGFQKHFEVQKVIPRMIECLLTDVTDGRLKSKVLLGKYRATDSV